MCLQFENVFVSNFKINLSSIAKYICLKLQNVFVSNCKMNLSQIAKYICNERVLRQYRDSIATVLRQYHDSTETVAPYSGPLSQHGLSAEGAKAKVVYMKEKYYGEYHHSLCLCNLSKCQQLILSKQSIYLQAVYIFHGATSILDGLVWLYLASHEELYFNINLLAVKWTARD